MNSANLEHSHYLIPQVVDHLYGDAPALGFLEHLLEIGQESSYHIDDHGVPRLSAITGNFSAMSRPLNPVNTPGLR